MIRALGNREDFDHAIATVSVLCLLAGIALLHGQAGGRTLDIYFIDTEGGQSTLYVGPGGETYAPRE
jgi:hypothetical protein